MELIMNSLGTNIIKYIFSFILPKDFKKHRLICKNINNIVTAIRFNKIIFNMAKIFNGNIIKFRDFINKYGLYINIKNLSSMRQLNNYNKVIKSIVFNTYFNDDIITSFPAGLQTLIFNYNFNKKIRHNILPEGLTNLFFGYAFDQEIESGVLPSSLKRLTFNGKFNKKIYPNVLPNLEELILSDSFNQEIEEHVLPKTLEKLQFNRDFNKNLNTHNIPENLKILMISKNYTANIILDGYIKTESISYHMYKKD
jgi:hypothetical protein